jgi:UDP-glucose 4-epimerase
MSVLVTGGTGFIGGYVVDRLRDGGERVVTYNRAPAAAGLPGGVTSVQGELFELGRLSSTIAERGVRAIVHAAGMADPGLSVTMPAAAVTANAAGTLHLLEAARLAGFRGRVVLLSSMTVYGDRGDGSDHAALRPRTPFAASKAFADLLGQVYVHSHGVDVVSLRLSEVYGPGRRLPNLVDRIVDAALARRPLRLDAGLEWPYRLLHVEDAARAIVAAVDARCPASRIYDIVGEPVRPDQVVAIVRDRVANADIAFGAAPTAGAGEADPIAMTAADRELGYRPRWGLARGIDDLCAWRETEEAC